MLYTLTISPREQYPVQLVEVCAPRSKFDRETHRVQILGGGILRVTPSQLKPACREVELLAEVAQLKAQLSDRPRPPAIGQ